MNPKPYIILSAFIFVVCAIADIYWFFNQETTPDYLIEVNVVAVILCMVLVILQAVFQKNDN